MPGRSSAATRVASVGATPGSRRAATDSSRRLGHAAKKSPSSGTNGDVAKGDAFPARDLSQVNPLAELNRRAEDSPIQLLLLGSDDDVSFKNVVHAMWHGERQQSERHIRELSQHGAVDSSWKHPRRSESDIDDQI